MLIGVSFYTTNESNSVGDFGDYTGIMKIKAQVWIQNNTKIFKTVDSINYITICFYRSSFLIELSCSL